MKAIKKFIFLFLIFGVPVYSFGWGVQGHRIVGNIAEYYLTARARKAVHKILGDETMAMASNWGDFIKSDNAYRYISSWHYIDFDPGMSKDQIEDYLAKDTATDIYTKMNFLINELKNKELPMDKKKMDLKLLIHFVGDVHQPFHVGHREDLGGNKIKVMWFNKPTNLHAVWDEQLVDFQQLSYTEYTDAINHTTAEQRRAWQNQPISDWLVESYQLSEKLYEEIKEPDQKLSYRYNYDHIQQVNEQLLKAGVRLAGLLNDIFD
jgi:hypothetical protein